MLLTYLGQLQTAWQAAQSGGAGVWVMLAIAAAVLLFVVNTISGLLIVAIWWGVGLKTTEVVARGLRDQYRQYLAFWVLSVLCELLLLIPAIGGLVCVCTPDFS